MALLTLDYTIREFWNRNKVIQPKWQRIIVLCVLAYEALGCLAGGLLLIIAPDGRLMKMPVEIMNGAFRDFLIPGVILFLLGIINSIAFIKVLRKNPSAWFWAFLALGGLLIWFWIEIAILEGFHWLHAMWGLPVVAGCIAAISLLPSREIMLHRAALYCGIISSILFILVNIIVPLQYPGYSMASNVPSELSAIGAPTRTLWSVLATPYMFLMFAFAWGVLKSAHGNKRLRIAGIMLLCYAALGFLWPFAPMHQREVLAAGGGTIEDTMHLVLGAFTQVFYLGALGFAAAALGKGFRIYSIITFIVLLFFGALTFMESPGLSRNEPTPMIGVWERVNIGVFLLWVIVLAVILLQREKNYPETEKQNL